MDKCMECDMPLANAGTYHPYAACLMFKACHNSRTVSDNLESVMAYSVQYHGDSVTLRQQFAEAQSRRDVLGNYVAQLVHQLRGCIDSLDTEGILEEDADRLLKDLCNEAEQYLNGTALNKERSDE